MLLLLLLLLANELLNSVTYWTVKQSIFWGCSIVYKLCIMPIYFDSGETTETHDEHPRAVKGIT